MAALCRYDEFRVKTDRQLLQIVNDALALGLREALHALKSADTWAIAEDHFLKAKRLCAEASRLIPLASEIPEEERDRLEARLEHLREMLEGLSVLGHPAPTREGIPALARALWKAKGCPEGSAQEDWFQAERVLKSQTACVGS
jgi:hypothetical protein